MTSSTEPANVRVAAIQMNSASDVAANLKRAGALLEQAADRGAGLAVLPENFAIIGTREADIRQAGEPEGTDPAASPIQHFLSTTAARLGLWVIGGSLPIASQTSDRVHPAQCVYNDRGERVARYNKIHLFDVGVPDSTESYRESATFVPGENGPITIDSPFGRIGLSICYDLRFPELYRQHATDGAEILIAPAAFTYTTGLAHWHLLTRTRAVENLATMIAPNQAGHHDNGRRTYGHSLICDPWGNIQAEARSDEDEVVIADIDRARLAKLREGFPCLSHRRL